MHGLTVGAEIWDFAAATRSPPCSNYLIPFWGQNGLFEGDSRFTLFIKLSLSVQGGTSIKISYVGWVPGSAEKIF
jgi:hypothetical protein